MTQASEITDERLVRKVCNKITVSNQTVTNLLSSSVSSFIPTKIPNWKFLKLRFFLLCSLIAEAQNVTLYSRRGKPSFFSLEVVYEADVRYFRTGPQLARQGPIMLPCRQENVYRAIISI